ncbi:hypothetical protein H8A97_30510 [Bradyrhizobium sp. Arg62]|uniref:hypothetical protein n=1 Tax=Bradyrhizobium brasilense TaxID=1419277 RepID=UPI001E3CCA9E|nr:hypothetical protein [Bradyrhizobium brasilense]MCC8949319.1 hypothetical protein [Bradyrhizobium brasilense]
MGRPLMNTLSRMLTTATAILAEQRQRVGQKDQPPFFIRTTWLFAELELLAPPAEENIFQRIKVARLSKDVAALGPLLDLIDTNTGVMEDGQRRHEREQLVGWIREQITREITNGN